ncbi:MAG TPA: hypothetical protein VGK34_09590 [Armatimonadota bacterium]|jgi:hypothetical protein
MTFMQPGDSSSQKSTKTKRAIKLIVILIAIFVVLRFFPRFALYPQKERTITFSNGAKVIVNLADIRRMEGNRVIVTMDISSASRKNEDFVIPDMEIANPKAVLVNTPPKFDVAALEASSRNEDHFSAVDDSPGAAESLQSTVACFDLKQDARTIDIAQTLYYLKKSDRVEVELPLAVHSVKQERSARVEIIDVGKGRDYPPTIWRPVSGDGLKDPSAAFYVRVKQTDPDGSLIPWTESAPGLIGWDESCTAELVDRKGGSVPMAANFVAYRDCKHSESTLMDLNPPREKLRRKIIHAVTLGHVRITGGMGSRLIMDTPGNGEWIYAFNVKDPSRYSKIRIKYVLPPKPEDRITVRFNNVPI